MKSFEQWWLKYYKISVIAGLFFVVFYFLKNDFGKVDINGAIVFFAVITSPLGALIGQVLVWLFKLLKLCVEIFVEFLKLRKANRH